MGIKPSNVEPYKERWDKVEALCVKDLAHPTTISRAVKLLVIPAKAGIHALPETYGFPLSRE
jgi:hypothetical protein